MTALAAPEVKGRSIRVALTATLVVGLTYLFISLAVVTLVTGDLTNTIDRRLADSLRNVPREVKPGDEPFKGPPGDRPFGPKLLVWTIRANGTVITTDESAPTLPAEQQHVGNPQNVTLAGTELRLAGAPVGDAYVVVGQTLDEVSRARSTIILAEILIAPILLAVVFLGAVLIGRRVAAPIELARRRQLEFTADASHELRTPLSVIEAHTSLALTQERTAAWYKTAFERVDHESKRMHELLDNLLWLARFDATKAAPNAEPVDLGILASQAADRFGVIAETRQLHLGLHVAEQGAVVSAPPEWLDRLLGVLLDNACKYVPEGGTVDLTVRRDGGRVRLVVDDSGTPESPTTNEKGSSTVFIGPPMVPAGPGWAWRSARPSSTRPGAAGRWAARRPAAHGWR